MKRFKNILAVYGQVPGDEATLRRATTLARRNSARLTVAGIVEEPDHMNATTGIQREQSEGRVVAERREHLERLIVSIRHEGVEVRGMVLTGEPFLVIIQAVLREKHDLVILTAEAQVNFKKMLFGSTSMHLMRKCPCPVWVTDPDRPSDNYSRILAAVDTFTSDEKNDALNTLIMDLSSSLARIDQSELHVVHAWEMNRRDDETSRSEITRDIMDRLIQRNRGAHQLGVDALLSRYELEDIRYQVHLIQGKARSAIPRLAAEIRANLLVMGTVSRTGVAGFFIGNSAEAILRQVDCSVLTLKPPGFVTPVTL